MRVGETEKEREMGGGRRGGESEQVTDTEERAAERTDSLLSLPGSYLGSGWGSSFPVTLSELLE